MQKMAKAEFLQSKLEQIIALGGDGREVLRRVLEAADVEDIDKILPPPAPKQPDPVVQADVNLKTAQADKASADAEKARAETAATGFETQDKSFDLGTKVGMAA
jgi:hypothetical protein